MRKSWRKDQFDSFHQGYRMRGNKRSDLWRSILHQRPLSSSKVGGNQQGPSSPSVHHRNRSKPASESTKGRNHHKATESHQGYYEIQVHRSGTCYRRARSWTQSNKAMRCLARTKRHLLRSFALLVVQKGLLAQPLPCLTTNRWVRRRNSRSWLRRRPGRYTSRRQ